MATIRLWLRKDNIDKEGFAPICLVYQLHNQRKFHSTKIKLRPENWSIETQTAIYLDKKRAKQLLPMVEFNSMPSPKDIENINADLTAIKKVFVDQATDFERGNVVYSAEMVSNTVKESKKPITKKDIKTSVVDFIEQYAKDAATTKRIGSIKVYKTLATHIKAFEVASKTKVTFETINTATLKQFYNYLIVDMGMNNTTTAKYLSTLKTMLNFARVEYKTNVNQDYRDFKASRGDGNNEVIVLTERELKAIIDLDLTNNKRLDRIRDIFVFSCTTGLRFSDLEDLKREHIRGGAIRKTCVKTGQPLEIPLNSISDSILEKYRLQHEPLPMISSQKLNEYIKEVGELAEIITPIEIARKYGTVTKANTFIKHELMSIHMGRKTFATLSLSKGMKQNDVMKITGHTTFASFKRYVNVSSEQAQEGMVAAWGAPTTKLKAVLAKVV